MKPCLYHYSDIDYEIYIAHWHTGLDTCTSIRIYKQIKTTIDRSTYLDILETPTYRRVIAQLRLSSHKLAIETGRHNKINLHDRKCTHCTLLRFILCILYVLCIIIMMMSLQCFNQYTGYNVLFCSVLYSLHQHSLWSYFCYRPHVQEGIHPTTTGHRSLHHDLQKQAKLTYSLLTSTKK